MPILAYVTGGSRFVSGNPGPGFGVGSVMAKSGLGSTSTINTDGVGATGSIIYGFGIGSRMTNNGLGKTGLINTDGVGEEGDI